MKKIIIVCLMPFLCLAQTQIGNDIYGESVLDWCGNKISLSADGSIAAIASYNSNNNGSAAGHVRIFQNISGAWIQIGENIEGLDQGEQSGTGLSLSADGTVVAIGAIGNNENGIQSGQVRVYKNIEDSWIQVGAGINGESEADYSGAHLSLSADGTVVAIGAYGNDGNGNFAGHVRVYENFASTWIKVGEDIYGEALDFSGWDVSLSSDGTIVAIGASNNSGNGAASGCVRVYRNIENTWTQIGDDILGEDAMNFSGASLSLSGNGSVLAIGAAGNDISGSESGHVRVYQNISDSWIQIGTDINGESEGDRSGARVSLSTDGKVVAIGAPGNDDNGVNAGQVRVFQNIAGTWVQVGTNINGQAAEDESAPVSLSADGSIVAIGAPDNDGNGIGSGHVRIFDLSAVLISSDNFVQTNFLVYPNPTANVVTIQLNEGLQLEKVNVYTALGQLVKTETNTIISLNELAKGSYFLEVITNQGKATKTILVE